MSSFTILGSGDNKAIAPRSLIGMLKEVQIALRELKFPPPHNQLDSIKSLNDVEVEEEKFCEYLWYAFFEEIKDEAPEEDDEFHVNNFGILYDEFVDSGDGIAHIPQELDVRGISHTHHIVHCFKAIYKQEFNCESILPKSLQPKGVNLKQSLSTIIDNICDKHHDAGRAQNAISGDFYYADDFGLHFARLFYLFTTEIKNRFNIDPIALFIKIYMQKEFIDKTIDSNLKEEGLTMTKLTLRIIEQKMQEGKSLKEVLELLFPPLKDESKFQKACSFLHNDLRLSTLNDKELFEHEFDIDSEYIAEIESSLDSIYEKSYNATQILDSLFEKFEDILLKSDDYNTYSTEQKSIVDNLKVVYTSLGEALLKLNSMLEVKEDLSPRAKKRLYTKGINDMQEAIDKIGAIDGIEALNKDTNISGSQSNVGADSSNGNNTIHSPSNPFMNALN